MTLILPARDRTVDVQGYPDTGKGAGQMRAAFAKTILVVDEGSLASTRPAAHRCLRSRRGDRAREGRRGAPRRRRVPARNPEPPGRGKDIGL